MATPIQRAEQTNYLIGKIGSGSTANVWLSVPKAIADRVLGMPGSTLSEDEQDQACKKLRGALQATKVAVSFANDQIYNFRDEVSVLQELSVRNLRNATKLLEFDGTATDSVWFNTELLAGRTLEQFLAKFKWTENFAWHCVRQLMETFSSVYFGDPHYYQGDVRAANLMFRVHGQEGVFPDLVLIDFGQAKKIGSKDDVAFFDRQREDLRECFRVLAFDRGNSPNELRDLAAGVQLFCDSEKGNKGNGRLENMVRVAHGLALKRVGVYDLSSALIEYFGAGLETEDGRPVTRDDLLSCRASKEEPDDDVEACE